MRFCGKAVCVLLAALLILSVTGCGAEQKADPALEERKNELAQEFMLELRDDIVPLRESPEDLASLQYVVSTQDNVLEMQQLDVFYDAYKADQDSVVTLVFFSSSFVVARVVYDHGQGYYFRYQFELDKPISVDSALIDKISLETDDSAKKKKLVLNNKDKEYFFTLKKPIYKE